MTVSAAEFVTTFQQSRTPAEVAAKLGIRQSVVNSRASRYRQAGVKLKKMNRRRIPKLDVRGLNEIVEELS